MSDDLEHQMNIGQQLGSGFGTMPVSPGSMAGAAIQAIPVQPAPVAPTQPAPTQPELNPTQVHERNLRALLEQEYVDPETGKIREELAGGELPSIEDIRSQSLGTLEQTLEGLKNRKIGREIGFAGEYTDVAGGQDFDRFKTSVGTRSGYTDEYGKLTALGKQAELAETPTMPEGTELQLERITPGEDEFLDDKKYAVDETAGQIATQTAGVADVPTPTKTGATSFEAEKSFEDIKNEAMEAAKLQGLTDTVQAQTGVVEKEATVQGQLEGLMAQFGDGKVPAFAAGAIRLAEQRLAARGMGASSMAGAAIVQAAMEAATPIAAADAQTYRSMQELNLNNRQQAEVLNAQMTMRLDLANLNNEQQARVTNTANRVQSLFNDQAATNASRQFNAANEQQNDQFFASLFNNAAQFKAAQQNAMNRFNAGQQNTVAQFNATLRNTREQFNQKNAILIDQANAVYRRNINTANTAMANAENEYNVRTLFNISQTAQNNLLQEYRDQVNFARVTSLNETAFQNQLALSSFAFDKDLELAEQISRSAVETRLLGGVIDAVFN
jgi:hypothetical protein|tara:strand:+ start:127 stop:1794 length:1668 start_codon:yes stop_codon:yes gene_type:complete